MTAVIEKFEIGGAAPPSVQDSRDKSGQETLHERDVVEIKTAEMRPLRSTMYKRPTELKGLKAMRSFPSPSGES